MDMDKKVIRDYTIKRQGTGSNVIEEGQKAYSDLKKPETYFSVKIGNNIKCVESTKKKAPKYTFDLVVDNTVKSRGPGDYKVAAEEIKRKKSLFGGSKKQGSNVVFSLRADTVEIYNNWVDKINAIAENSTTTEAVVAVAPSGSIYSSNSVSTSPSVRSSPSVSTSNSVAASPSVSQTDLFKTSLYEIPEPAAEKAPEKDLLLQPQLQKRLQKRKLPLQPQHQKRFQKKKLLLQPQHQKRKLLLQLQLQLQKKFQKRKLLLQLKK